MKIRMISRHDVFRKEHRAELARGRGVDEIVCGHFCNVVPALVANGKFHLEEEHCDETSSDPPQERLHRAPALLPDEDQQQRRQNKDELVTGSAHQERKSCYRAGAETEPSPRAAIADPLNQY